MIILAINREWFYQPCIRALESEKTPFAILMVSYLVLSSSTGSVHIGYSYQREHIRESISNEKCPCRCRSICGFSRVLMKRLTVLYLMYVRKMRMLHRHLILYSTIRCCACPYYNESFAAPKRNDIVHFLSELVELVYEYADEMRITPASNFGMHIVVSE